MVRAAAAKGDTASPSTDGDAAATTAACRPEHAFHAFDALYCALTRAQPIKPAFADDKFPLFVTWNTRRHSGSTRLRGCIGTFDAQPLRTALKEYALVSAFRDHRFERIELRELPSLECGISLLTDFEDAASYLDWTVGTHGIQISFAPPAPPPASDAPSPLSSAISLLSSHRGSGIATPRTLSATYLPEGRAGAGVGPRRRGRQRDTQGRLGRPYLGGPPARRARAPVPEPKVRRWLGRVCRVARGEGRPRRSGRL
ncbi:alport syndrome [Lactarius hatsudake]|nr:alport syndrome [Lactarius hatsudake]